MGESHCPPWKSPERRVRVNFRIPQDDLEQLRELAYNSGVHYQTLVVSILHQYVTGQLIDRRVVASLLGLAPATTPAAPATPATPAAPAGDLGHGLWSETGSGEFFGSFESDESCEASEAEQDDWFDGPASTAPTTSRVLADAQVDGWVSINSPPDLLFDEARRLRMPYSALVRSVLHKYLDNQYVDVVTASQALRRAFADCHSDWKRYESHAVHLGQEGIV